MTPSLDGLYEELQRGRIYECSLRNEGRAQFYGLSEGQDIFIDPRPAVLEFLVHELLHRRHPSLSERAVTLRARRLVVRMDEPTKAKWWRAYNRIKRKARPVEIGE